MTILSLLMILLWLLFRISLLVLSITELLYFCTDTLSRLWLIELFEPSRDIFFTYLIFCYYSGLIISCFLPIDWNDSYREIFWCDCKLLWEVLMWFCVLLMLICFEDSCSLFEICLLNIDSSNFCYFISVFITISLANPEFTCPKDETSLLILILLLSKRRNWANLLSCPLILEGSLRMFLDRSSSEEYSFSSFFWDISLCFDNPDIILFFS